jgi:DNA-3-methyladenine glycosylase II
MHELLWQNLLERIKDLLIRASISYLSIIAIRTHPFGVRISVRLRSGHNDDTTKSFSNPMTCLALTEETYGTGLNTMMEHDPDLAAVVRQWGKPPFWVHPPGFAGLIIAILSQQVSLESATAAFSKLAERVDPLTPEGFLTLDERALKKIGFSRQKAAYARNLASEMLDGRVDLGVLDQRMDHQVRDILVRLRGVGPWTANCYLLFSLRRPDAWPSGDLALAKAIQEIRGLAEMPSWEEIDEIADQWRPLRAIAARILWHHYLSIRGRGSTV